MSKIMTYDYWLENFEPIASDADNGVTHYETYGNELDYVIKQDPKQIWTEVQGDYGTYIVSGFRYINRLQYYITKNKWDDEYTEVPTWIYEDNRNIPCETADDLKRIYRNEANIIG